MCVYIKEKRIDQIGCDYREIFILGGRARWDKTFQKYLGSRKNTTEINVFEPLRP
jgi:hypothetical protein